MVLSEKTKEKIKKHALEKSDEECCGLLLVIPDSFDLEAIPCKNIHEDRTNFFTIDPKDYLKASLKGKIIGFYHSHINDTLDFSDFDKLNAENSKLNAVLYNVNLNQFNYYFPIEYEFPYVGRQYVLGFIDCLSLVRDWFYREKNIILNEMNHPYRFVNDKVNHEDNKTVSGVLPDYFRNNHFIEINKNVLRPDDIILMKTSLIKSPVHAAIYRQSNQILHHPYKKISILEDYRAVYINWTTHVFRHESLL